MKMIVVFMYGHRVYLSDPLPHPSTCSESGSPSPSELLRDLHQLNARLGAFDLRPSPETDATFGRLVELCTSAGDRTARDVLARPETTELLRSLRGVSSRGETQLERHWANEVVRAEDAWSALRRFPYLDNYRDLVRVELAAATAAGHSDPRSVVVLGAGPLPLTGLLLAHEHGARVVNVDCEARACALGSEVTSALSLSDRVRTIQADAADAGSLDEAAEADLVVLAALVGEDSIGKQPVLAALAHALHPKTTLLVRSAHGMRTALYPQVCPDDLHGFRPLLEVRPWNEVVNSVLAARPA